MGSFFSWLKTKTGIGLSLLIGSILLLPVIYYYFATFYFASPETYKAWYPNLHWIAYPVVKILPFVFMLLVSWLLYRPALNQIRNFIKSVKQEAAALQANRRTQYFVSVLKVLLVKSKPLLLNILVLAISTAFVLGIAEFALRSYGVKPGYRLSSAYFRPVDSLYTLNGFIADSNGMFCIAPETREYLRKTIATKNSKEELDPLTPLQSTEVYTLAEDFIGLRQPDFHSPFKTFLENIDSNTDTTDAELFSAIKEYTKSPINSNGFKSIEFKKYPSKRKSILLLGDSFTWGHSSLNKTNCFADVLLSKGYIVYNTGITGIDPAQYLLTAQLLIPQLQPDYVVVNFYMGNDIIFFERKPQPYIPLFYCTNAGNLISCPEGIYLYSAEEAYRHTLSAFKIPTEFNSFNKFCAKTAVGTIVWRAGARFHLVDVMLPEYVEYYKRVQQITTETPYSDVQIAQIKQLTEQHGSKFLITIIPALDRASNFVMPEDKQPLLTGIEYHVPPVTKEDYEVREDGHYNDRGHHMHADFIDSLINTLQ